MTEQTERFHSHVVSSNVNWFFFSKESIYLRKELKSLGTGLGRQRGCRFIDLAHQHGGHSLTYVFWCNI